MQGTVCFDCGIGRGFGKVGLDMPAGFCQIPPPVFHGVWSAAHLGDWRLAAEQRTRGVATARLETNGNETVRDESIGGAFVLRSHRGAVFAFGWLRVSSVEAV